jgi:hypothetical protein
MFQIERELIRALGAILKRSGGHAVIEDTELSDDHTTRVAYYRSTIDNSVTVCLVDTSTPEGQEHANMLEALWESENTARFEEALEGLKRAQVREDL